MLLAAMFGFKFAKCQLLKCTFYCILNQVNHIASFFQSSLFSTNSQEESKDRTDELSKQKLL